ncbi:2-oxoglutarate dehydrogenase, E2 component, dihydrolipoamide succinyltransferase [Mycolicibacterium sp.]|uniref:2-oxoglutarate dehydrogenase, E2 component, dihydrolipoamide succinyltransferase n=1 Tax=Mycolicibacterium sp. TaxID=2320850 RepID=UPI0037CA8BFE
MPKLGESVTEGTLSTWLKAVGDSVEFDDPLFEVSTDKVDSEIPSPFDGVLLEILVEAGETVPIGTELARIGPAGASTATAASAPTPELTPVLEAATQTPATSEPAVDQVTMPKLGESITEGTVSAWLKSVGDVVAFDDPLFEVSTDKVDSEIPSPFDGVLREILVQAGETVAVGTVLARIASEGNGSAGDSDSQKVDTKLQTPAASSSSSPKVHASGAGVRLLSPVVRRLVEQHKIDLTRISGTGNGGRITRNDVTAAIASNGSGDKPPKAATAATAAPTAPAAPEVPARKPSAAADNASDSEVIPLSRIRIITAERMVQSLSISPHVWTSVEVDLERIEAIRRQHKERFKKDNGASLTYLPFIARVTCDALRAFPTVNSSVNMTDKTMTLHKQVHLAIAVDLDEQGLMAPVIRDADSLNLRGLAKAIKAVGDGAKNKTLKSADLAGSTFTITNPGPLGSYASAPIINQPNVAIMSTEGVARRAVVVGDALAIHHTCVLGFSYDHRAFDGVTAARFLMYIRDALQDRDWEAELA